MKYVKNPVVIDAIQWTGTAQSFDRIRSAFPDMVWNPGPMGTRSFIVLNKQGDMTASCGDYIVRGVEGEYYPCPSSVFEATHTKLEDGDGAK